MLFKHLYRALGQLEQPLYSNDDSKFFNQELYSFIIY